MTATMVTVIDVASRVFNNKNRDVNYLRHTQFVNNI